MQQAQTRITLHTNGIALHDFTKQVNDWLVGTGIHTGLVTVFCRHTSASLLINENAAPAVQRDLLRWLAENVREDAIYEHDTEGRDDMPAHIRTMLTACSLSVPVVEGRLALGLWQGIYLAEHRRSPHERQIVCHVIGE